MEINRVTSAMPDVGVLRQIKTSESIPANSQ